MTVRPAKTQNSLGIHPVCSESSLYAQWVAKDQGFLHADSEDSDQTGRMPRLIWVFAWRKVILLVLSRGGSVPFCLITPCYKEHTVQHSINYVDGLLTNGVACIPGHVTNGNPRDICLSMSSLIYTSRDFPWYNSVTISNLQRKRGLLITLRTK